MPRPANLRVCASCEWIFKWENPRNKTGCPKCEFASYSARYVYGNTAYALARTQKPWYDKKLSAYAQQLHKEINESKPAKDALILTERL